MNPEYYADIAARLARLQAEERLRRLPQGDFGLPMAISQGREYLNLSSNDYLGIAADKDLRDEFFAFARDLSFGSTGSRLMTGNSEPYRDFERELEQAYGLPALVFGSGFQANTGILPALAERGDLVLADRLVHASIIDGVLACKADFLRYRHNDYDHLESLLAKNASKYRYVWIVSESIFSMDGDRADVARLVELKRKYGALLYLDQAHSIGTDGSSGLGVCAPDGRWSAVDVSVFPMGKAMASHGAFVVTRPEIKDYLVNTSRPMIFSTALPPVCVAWSAYVFRKMRSMQAFGRAFGQIARRTIGIGVCGFGQQPYRPGGIRVKPCGARCRCRACRARDLGYGHPLSHGAPGAGSVAAVAIECLERPTGRTDDTGIQTSKDNERCKASG